MHVDSVPIPSSFSWLTTRATQLILLIIILVPPLEVFLGDRDLIIRDYMYTLERLPAFPVMRLGTLMCIALSVLVIGLCLLEGRQSASGRAVWRSYVFFFVTNVVLCGLFGAVPQLTRSDLYPALVFAAFYLSRDDGPWPLVDTAKSGLLIMMVTSLVCLFAYPEKTQRVFDPELRIPFIEFRFWGLGDSANGIAPLALELSLLTLARPYAKRWLNWVSNASAFSVFLLAQSQTNWLAGIVIVPWFLLYRSGYNVGLKTFVRSRFMLACVGLAIATVVILRMPAGSDGAVVDQSAATLTLSGRLDAWSVAFDTFLSHPIFGYGLLAWQPDFRAMIGLNWAVHAHNQLLQSLSVGGILGGLGVVWYVSVLCVNAARVARATDGLAPALLAIVLFRCVTEVPFTPVAAILGEAVAQILLLRLVVMSSSNRTEVCVAGN